MARAQGNKVNVHTSTHPCAQRGSDLRAAGGPRTRTCSRQALLNTRHSAIQVECNCGDAHAKKHVVDWKIYALLITVTISAINWVKLLPHV